MRGDVRGEDVAGKVMGGPGVGRGALLQKWQLSWCKGALGEIRGKEAGEAKGRGMGHVRGHQAVGGWRAEVGDFQAGCDLMMGEQHLRVTGHEMGARAGEGEARGRHWGHNLASLGTVWHFETCESESLD